VGQGSRQAGEAAFALSLSGRWRQQGVEHILLAGADRWAQERLGGETNTDGGEGQGRGEQQGVSQGLAT
jgi:hypothetical protein